MAAVLSTVPAKSVERIFPLPESVCTYGSEEEFLRQRKESGQWVFWEDRVDLVLEGRYDEIRPLHVELSPTYLCNFACPWCSCRAAREDWGHESVFDHPKANEFTVMSSERLGRLMANLAYHRVDIQWVGGEPTMHNALYPMAAIAHEYGLKQCLFTNGSLLNERRIKSLFESKFAFIRVSLDASSEAVHRKHHGYSQTHDYARRVRENLAHLVHMKVMGGEATQVAVSLVVDETNLDDVLPTFEFIHDLCVSNGYGSVDYVIVRPTFQFYTSQLDMRADTGAKLKRLIRLASEGRTSLEKFGTRVIAPEASFYHVGCSGDEANSGRCLSAGWFSEITPTGDMLLCSDRYGNPEYIIGNAVDSTLDDIWIGRKRNSTLRFANAVSCFGTRCPRNGRGFAFNAIFHQIERFRREKRLDEVRNWISELRVNLPRPEHSFFL